MDMNNAMQVRVNCVCTYHIYPMIVSNMTMFSILSSSGIGLCKCMF